MTLGEAPRNVLIIPDDKTAHPVLYKSLSSLGPARGTVRSAPPFQFESSRLDMMNGLFQTLLKSIHGLTHMIFAHRAQSAGRNG